MTDMLEQIRRAELEYPPHLYDLVFDESGTLIGATLKIGQKSAFPADDGVLVVVDDLRNDVENLEILRPNLAHIIV